LKATAERIAASLSRPVVHDGVRLQVTASIGIAAYPEHATDAVLLLKLADSAMYRGKRSGKNRVFTPDAQ
jgi:diguanylate cyclase (GGDEF)-like protein